MQPCNNGNFIIDKKLNGDAVTLKQMILSDWLQFGSINVAVTVSDIGVRAIATYKTSKLCVREIL